MTPSFFWTWSKQNTTDTFKLKSAHSGVMELEFEGKSQKVIDLSSLSYQASFGHTPEFISSAIKAQMEQFSVASPKAHFELKEFVAQALVQELALGAGKVYFCNSGSEAIENALKIVRAHKKRKIILSRQISYHGSTLGSLSVTGDWRRTDHSTVDEWNAFIPEPSADPDLARTRELILKIGPENIAGFCLETITGGNGVIIASSAWWQGIQKLCREFDLALILDEVVCGFGRTGKYFGVHHYPELRPDLVCMAKAITGGVFPLGAVFVSEAIAKTYDEETFSIGTTNTGHPLGMAAAKAVIVKLQSSEFWENLKLREEMLTNSMNKIRNYKGINEVRQIGLLIAIDMDTPPKWSEFIRAGLYLVVQKNRLILAPALNMTVDEYTEALYRLEKILKQ